MILNLWVLLIGMCILWVLISVGIVLCRLVIEWFDRWIVWIRWMVV